MVIGPAFHPLGFTKLLPDHVLIGISQLLAGLDCSADVWKLAPDPWFRTICRQWNTPQRYSVAVVEELADLAGVATSLCCSKRRHRHEWCHCSLVSAWLRDASTSKPELKTKIPTPE